MQIEYVNAKVKKIFTNPERLMKACGFEITRAIKKRINELTAAQSFSVFLSLGVGKPHSLQGAQKGCFSISLTANYRLIIKPEAEDLHSETLKICTIIEIQGVDDYHGGKSNWIVP